MLHSLSRCGAMVAAMLLVGLQQCDCRPWPDTTSGVHVFNDQLASGMNEALTQFSATHYAGCQKMLRSDADSLRLFNPNFLILHYRLGLGLGFREPDAYGDPTGPYLLIIEGDQWVREWPTEAQDEWFYPYSGSLRVYNNMWGWYLIEPDNAAWRTYWLGEVSRQLVANDDDGLFADSVSVPNYLDPYSFTPNLPEIDSVFESDWSAKIGRWTGNIKTGLGSSYKLVPNAGFWITTRDTTNYSGADGVMIEGFGAWGQTDPFELADWQLQMNRILGLVAQGRILIAQTYVDRPNDMAWRMYTLANYLLIKGTSTFINMDMGYDPEWFPEYGVNIGSFTGGVPTGIGELYRNDWQVYAREYTNGLALVNPSGATKTFDVGPGYQLVTPHGGGLVPNDGDISSWHLSYEPAASITLQPYSGAVLVKSGPDGFLSVAPGSGFSSSGLEGGPFVPSSTEYTLTNTGGASINWTITHLPDAAWVTLSPTSGVLEPGGSASVTVSVNSNANTLPAGTYNDTVTFTNATNGQGNTTRSVQLSIAGPQPVGLTVTPPDSFISSGSVGGPFVPSSLVYTVANEGDFPLDFTVVHAGAGNWLSLYHTLPARTSKTVTASLSSLATSLGPGVYSDTIAFTNITNGQGNTTRPAQITVTGATLSVTPDDGLASNGYAGGPFSPSVKQYVLMNQGTLPISWTATHGSSATWITLSGTSGTLSAGGSTVVTVAINSNAESLPGGTYTDTVTFTNTTTGMGNTTRPVSLTVYQGVLTVTPSDGLSSSGAVGGPFSPSLKTYMLTNSGNSSINWTVAHDPSVGWITLSGASDSLAPGTSTNLTVSVNSNANTLPQGIYSDTVTFTNTTNGVGSTTRSVSLVAATRQLTAVVVSPTSLSCPSADARQLHAIAYFSDSSALDITSTGTWASSRTTVCRVSASGVLTPVGQGSANVTCSYTSSGITKTGTCAVSVSYQTIYYLYISPSSLTFYSATPSQFSCQARTRSGWQNVTDVCEWTSSAPSIATVDWRGLVTPVSRGAATITARYRYNGAYMSVTAMARVEL